MKSIQIWILLFAQKNLNIFFKFQMKLLFVELITIYNSLTHQKINNKTSNVYFFY